MPPIRTDKPRLEAGDNIEKKLPSLRKIFVSISRVKPYVGPKWNCQLSIDDCTIVSGERIRLSSIEFTQTKFAIGDLLNVDIRQDSDDEDGERWSLVWPMSESRRLGRVSDDVSLQAAVQDYRRAGKSIVELYVIKNKGKHVFCAQQ